MVAPSSKSASKSWTVSSSSSEGGSSPMAVGTTQSGRPSPGRGGGRASRIRRKTAGWGGGRGAQPSARISSKIKPPGFEDDSVEQSCSKIQRRGHGITAVHSEMLQGRTRKRPIAAFGTGGHSFVSDYLHPGPHDPDKWRWQTIGPFRAPVHDPFRLHAYVSADPSVAVEGSALPAHGRRPILGDVERAVSALTRCPLEALRGPEQPGTFSSPVCAACWTWAWTTAPGPGFEGLPTHAPESGTLSDLCPQMWNTYAPESGTLSDLCPHMWNTYAPESGTLRCRGAGTPRWKVPFRELRTPPGGRRD